MKILENAGFAMNELKRNPIKIRLWQQVKAIPNVLVSRATTHHEKFHLIGRYTCVTAVCK